MNMSVYDTFSPGKTRGKIKEIRTKAERQKRWLSIGGGGGGVEGDWERGGNRLIDNCLLRRGICFIRPVT